MRAKVVMVLSLAISLGDPMLATGQTIRDRTAPKLSPRQAPQAPRPGPVQDPPEFPAPAPAAAAGMNALYVCEANDGSRITAHLESSGKLTLKDPQTGEQAPGTYTWNGTQMQISVPSHGFDQTSQQVDLQKGLLITFVMPTVYCYLLGHEIGPAVAGYVKCPKIGYIPSVGWQENAFEFYNDHSVKWRQWDELTGAADTLYGEYYGIYLIEGSQIYMAFGAKEKDRYLSGTLDQNYNLLISELEPASGACTPN